MISPATARLIRKLERARRGDLDLTADVYECLGFTVRRANPAGVSWRYFKGARWLSMSDLTESVDAAARLLPEHWGWSAVYNFRRIGRPKRAIVCVADKRRPGTLAFGAFGGCQAATVPLALVAAILRATDGRGLRA